MADDKVILDAALELLRIKGTMSLKDAVAEVRAALGYSMQTSPGIASPARQIDPLIGFVTGAGRSPSIAELAAAGHLPYQRLQVHETARRSADQRHGSGEGNGAKPALNLGAVETYASPVPGKGTTDA